ncbi:MAG: ATP-binding protein [Anaeromyxobacter sp.]
MSGAREAIVQSVVSSGAFSAVLALALAYTWRLYRQRYLLLWSAYWAIYLGVWILDGWMNYEGFPPNSPGWVAARAGMTFGALGARAFLALGVLDFLGHRQPPWRSVGAVALAVIALASLSLGTQAWVAVGGPGWIAIPFRTYAIGLCVTGSMAWLVLRSDTAPPSRLLGVSLAVIAFSDLWDLTVEVFVASPWTSSGQALYLSYFVVHLTYGVFAAGMLAAAIGTERRRAERATEELLRRDRAVQDAQRQETIGQLAGGLAHDFNNLLTAVIGHVALVRDALPPGSEAAHDADVATEAAERAARLTRQLLTYARRQPSAPKVLDPNQVLVQLDRMAVPLLGPRIHRRLALIEQPWMVVIDPGQLEQLLLNLIVNARDAMPEGGSLRLETANEVLGMGPRAEDASRVPAGEWVRISVEDTGHGMDAGTRARMFEPFFTTKPPGRGSGLGLAAAQGIVQQAGGSIGVRSAPGRGTRISVFLPRARQAAAEAPAPAPEASTPRGSETVLLVEDDPNVRALAARALERRGYAVLTAADGEGALHLAASGLERVDLLVTDVAMPGMDGRALARKLRQLRPELPVLFISGYLASGPDSLEGPFLPKPFTPDALALRVRQTIDLAPPRNSRAPAR